MEQGIEPGQKVKTDPYDDTPSKSGVYLGELGKYGRGSASAAILAPTSGEIFFHQPWLLKTVGGNESTRSLRKRFSKSLLKAHAERLERQDYEDPWRMYVQEEKAIAKAVWEEEEAIPAVQAIRRMHEKAHSGTELMHADEYHKLHELEWEVSSGKAKHRYYYRKELEQLKTSFQNTPQQSYCAHGWIKTSI